MDIRNRRELKRFAGERLENARDGKKLVLLYTGLSIGLTVLVTVINYILGRQIDQMGGLRYLSMRRVLSSVQTVLPLVQSMVNTCLNVGFLAAMLRIARGQYVSPKTLRLGFDRFWVLLRCTIVRGMLYSAVMMLSVYLGIMIYMITPLSNNVMELLMPYFTDMSVLNSTIVLEEAVYAELAAMLWPAYLICGVLVAVIGLPMLYAYRMVSYVIIDKPALGALAALRESKMMMHGNRFQLFKLDLCMWWYHLALMLAMAVGYADVILPTLGVELPMSQEVAYFAFYALYLLLMAGIYYTMLDRVEVTYALAYDAVKPEDKQDGGVVLGNIFQM